MKPRAAIAFEAAKSLEILEFDLHGPKTGEVMIEGKATGVCHSNAFTRSGDDPEAHFPPYSATKYPFSGNSPGPTAWNRPR